MRHGPAEPARGVPGAGPLPARAQPAGGQPRRGRGHPGAGPGGRPHLGAPGRPGHHLPGRPGPGQGRPRGPGGVPGRPGGQARGRPLSDPAALRCQARAVLEAHWDPARGHCYPHGTRYPHQWLWDSCFTAICWAALGDGRAARELGTALSDQLQDGFVPHMRYAGPTIDRGPLGHASSFTQPPVYAHAAAYLAGHGMELPPDLLGRIDRALRFLWTRRRDRGGLVFIVHPWESGADDSPRWDSWLDADWTALRWDQPRFTAFDLHLVGQA